MQHTKSELEVINNYEAAIDRDILDENAVHHIMNRHGDVGLQDTSMKDAEGKAAPKVVIKKQIDGTYYVIEAVSDAKKHRNYIITAYIVPRNKENDPSVPNNAEALGLRPKRS